jgi:hypothetical protein
MKAHNSLPISEVEIPVKVAIWYFDESIPVVLIIPVLKACSMPSFAPTYTMLSFFTHEV